MLLRTDPDALAQGATLIDADSALLRGLAALFTAPPAPAGEVGSGPPSSELTRAVEDFVVGYAAVLSVLARGAELLAIGLDGAAHRYREADGVATGLVMGLPGA